MKYQVYCQGFEGQFSVSCDAPNPTEAKEIVRKKHPTAKILQVTMDIDLKKNL